MPRSRRPAPQPPLASRLTRWTRDWHRISVDTLRGWGLLVVLAVTAGIGWIAFHAVRAHQLEVAAERTIAECRLLLADVEDVALGPSFLGEASEARRSLEAATTLFDSRRFQDSLRAAEHSRILLESILDALGLRGSAGTAQFVATAGAVEYRRGATGTWERATPRVLLRSGDYVRTASDSSAEIIFFDGTLYNLQQNTLFLVTPPAGTTHPIERRVELRYGWLDLSTGEVGSEVSTPTAIARVAGESEATVGYDLAAGRSQVRSYRGAVEVEPRRGGLTRELGPLEAVLEADGRLSAVQRLPSRPAPIEPPDNLEIDPSREAELTLIWQPVPEADKYALEVARNRLFTDPVISTEDRLRPRARIGILGTGTFLWRVAAIDAAGRRGPWSFPQKFRVVDRRQIATYEDTTPPQLVLDEVQSYGSIFIVQGRTEPGSTVSLNGELVTVEADGSFTRTLQFADEGWREVTVRAVDPRGNESVRRQRVFIESL